MKTPRKILRECFPSLTDVAFLLPLIILFTRLEGARFLLGDGDTGWHIRAGDWILAHGRIPYQDMFSFTLPGQPWFAWEWLWDVSFAWLHAQGGLALVIGASLLVICCTFALLYRLACRHCPNPLIVFALLFLAISISSIHWLARPHVFTYLFIVVFLWVLEWVREGRVRLLWLLPPLTVLWANVHGGFPLAVVLTLVYAVGESAVLLVHPGPEGRRAALARGKPYLLAAVGCALATLINPNFYHLHVHIGRYLFNPFQYKYIIEFQSFNFQSASAPYLEILLALAALAAAWNLYQRRYTEAILAAAFIHPALMSARNVPIFAILIVPAVSRMVYELTVLAGRSAGLAWWKRWVRELEELGADVARMEGFARIPLASALGMAAVMAALFYLPARSEKFRAEYDPKTFPFGALSLLGQPDLADKIFTSYEWGGQLIYRLYPNTKVFIDGRSDFYGSQFCQKYMDLIDGRYDWKQTLNRYGVEAVLLPVDASLASTLKECRDWESVYDDGIGIVFLKRDSRLASALREAPRYSAVSDGGFSAIARSPTIPIHVAERPRSYARR